MAYITVSREVDIDIDIEDFDTDDLIEELERRNISHSASNTDKNLLSPIISTFGEK